MSVQIVNVSEVVEKEAHWSFVWLLVGLSSIIILLDGYEITALAYAAPAIVRALHLEISAFTPIFSLGPIGNIVGGIMFGYLGDRFGRRSTLAGAVVAYSLFSLLTAYAVTVPQFVLLRLLSGIAVGGLMPVLWALVIEYSPSRWRVTMLTIVMCGYLGGHALAGFVSAGLSPIFGWQCLFWFGAIAPMIVLVFQWFLLPESVQYLVSRGASRQKIVRVLKRVNPDIVIAPDARFIVSQDGARDRDAERFSIAKLFSGDLKLITPLLWLSLVCTTTTVFFFSWGPLLSEAAGMSTRAAALGATAYQIGGGFGSLVLARAIDKRGLMPIVVMPLLAAPLVVGLGFMHALSVPQFFCLMFVAGCMVLGGHHGLQAVVGLFYPTAYRSTGAGWAYGVGRIGSVLGPLIGGILLGHHWQIPAIFAVAATPLLFFAAAMLGVAVIRRQDKRAAQETLMVEPAPRALAQR